MFDRNECSCVYDASVQEIRYVNYKIHCQMRNEIHKALQPQTEWHNQILGFYSVVSYYKLTIELNNIIVVKCFWCEQMRDLCKYLRIRNVVCRWLNVVAATMTTTTTTSVAARATYLYFVVSTTTTTTILANVNVRVNKLQCKLNSSPKFRANGPQWDGTNMPIDKVPGEQLSFRLNQL